MQDDDRSDPWPLWACQQPRQKQHCICNEISTYQPQRRRQVGRGVTNVGSAVHLQSLTPIEKKPHDNNKQQLSIEMIANKNRGEMNGWIMSVSLGAHKSTPIPGESSCAGQRMDGASKKRLERSAHMLDKHLSHCSRKGMATSPAVMVYVSQRSAELWCDREDLLRARGFNTGKDESSWRISFHLIQSLEDLVNRINMD